MLVDPRSSPAAVQPELTLPLGTVGKDVPPGSNGKTPDQRLQQMREWRDHEIARQRSNRFEMAADADYYDGRQLSPETLRLLEERRQLPVVYNEVKQTIDWISGTERRTRFDFSVLPRVKADTQAAQGKTKLLKYLSDENNARYRQSDAFKEASICGISWIETGLTTDPDREPIYMRGESWRNVWSDSSALERDATDARYLFRRRSIDLDIAQALFPASADRLEADANANTARSSGAYYNGQPIDLFDDPVTMGDYDPIAWRSNPRKRVWLWEGWYYEPVLPAVLKALGSTWSPVKMRARLSIFCEHAMLHDDWSPYAHNNLPFVPIVAYRRWIDGQPYGVVRNIRSPQDALNKRMQKAVHAAATAQLLIEKSAIDDKVMPLKAIKREVARPDGVIVTADGALSGRRIEIRTQEAQVQMQTALAGTDREQIRSSGGVTGENLGQDTNATSGKAILAKQSQGSLVTAELFDVYHWSLQRMGELLLALVEQTYSDEKEFRLTGDRRQVDWATINERDPQTGQVLNPITAFKAQFVMAEQDYRASVRQAMFDQLGDLLGKLATFAPQAVLNILDIWLDYSDVPGKEAIVKRVRELTGQTDPDTPPTPEELAAIEDKKRKEAATEDMQMRMLQAELRATIAKAMDLESRTRASEATRLKAMGEAFLAALQGGNIAATMPHAAAAGDEILRASGFQDQGGTDPNIPGTTVPQPAAPLALPA